MTKLQEIYIEVEKVKSMEIPDFQKMKKIYDLQKQASKETWSPDEEYRNSANHLHDYIQTQWGNIYLETDKKTQEIFKKFIDGELLNNREELFF